MPKRRCASCLLPVPPGITPEQAAASLPFALLTMHDALVGAGRLQRGESVLIQGASSAAPGADGLQIAKLRARAWSSVFRDARSIAAA